MRRIPGAGSLWLRRVAKTVPPMRRVDQREARVQDYRISDPRVGVNGGGKTRHGAAQLSTTPGILN